MLYTFANFVQYLPFFFFFLQMCIIFATFCVYILQCKLTLQIQSKHIKITEKKTKTKTSLNQTGRT